MQNFSLTKMHLKTSSAKRRSFCSGGDELTLGNVRDRFNVLVCVDACEQPFPINSVQKPRGDIYIYLFLLQLLSTCIYFLSPGSECRDWHKISNIYHVLNRHIRVIFFHWRKCIAIANCRPQNYVGHFHHDVIKWKHFRVTGPLCGKFTGGRRIPLTEVNGAELLMFSLIWIKCWVNKNETGDWRRHRAHYDVTVMLRKSKFSCYVSVQRWLSRLPTFLINGHIKARNKMADIFQTPFSNAFFMKIFEFRL